MRTSVLALAVAAVFTGAQPTPNLRPMPSTPPTPSRRSRSAISGASVNRGRFDKKEGTVQFDRAR